MAKDNIRSFRFSGEVAAILEGQEGKSLNDKFETLVLFCYYKVEERREELAKVEKQIAERRQKLYDLERATERLMELERNIQTAKHYFSIVERGAKQIAEAVEQDKLPEQKPYTCDTGRDIIGDALKRIKK